MQNEWVISGAARRQALRMGTFIALLCGVQAGQAANAAEQGGEPEVSTVWPFRYVLKIDTPYFFNIRAMRGRKKLANPVSGQTQEIEAISDRVKTYVIENRQLEREEVVSTLLLEFDRDGRLLTPVDWPRKLGGRIDDDEALVLDDGSARSPVFQLGSWEAATDKASLRFSPALCSTEDEQRYLPGFTPNSVSGGFGCREWSFYQQNSRLPYIDVTTYQMETDRSAKPDRRGRLPQRVLATIKPSLGWGRFDVAPKPVIGKHGESWFCLQDCPDGDMPGYIPNMKSWLARHKWPAPAVPRSMPLFPDKA
jgi:hypothetical protein